MRALRPGVVLVHGMVLSKGNRKAWAAEGAVKVLERERSSCPNPQGKRCSLVYRETPNPPNHGCSGLLEHEVAGALWGWSSLLGEDGKGQPGLATDSNINILFVLLCPAQRGGSGALISHAVISGPQQPSAALGLSLMEERLDYRSPEAAASQCHQQCPGWLYFPSSCSCGGVGGEE